MPKSFYNLFLVIASVSLYFSVISPLYVGATSSFLPLPQDGIVTLMQKDKDLDSAIKQAQELSKEATDMKTNYDSITFEKRNQLMTMIPESIDPVRLVNEVNSIVNSSGFNLDSISYSQNDAPQMGEGVKAYTVNISTQGSYASFSKTLIKNFESSLRFYNIKSVNFVSTEKVTDPITFQVKLETYYLK